MSPALNDVSIILNAFGAGIGIFWIYLLLRRKTKHFQHFFLAGLLFLFVFFMINTIIQLSGYGSFLQNYQDFANALGFLLGPLLWGYCLTHTQSDDQWLKSFWWHALPFLFALILQLGSVLENSSIFSTHGLIHLWNLQTLIYLGLGHRALIKHRPEAILPGFLIRNFSRIWLLNLVFFLIKAHWFPVPDILFLNVTLLLSFLIVIIALQTLEKRENASSDTQAFALPENQYHNYSSKLKNLMEQERLYRNPDLNLQKLARTANISPRYISATLNHHFQQSFYEFVNGYRVKEVIEKLKTPDTAVYTLNGLASQAGFKSNSAFYKAFRTHTGMTPGAFKKQLRHTEGSKPKKS